MTHEQACGCDEAASHQFPIAAAFWIIWIVSTEECSSLMPNLMQICCSTCSAIFKVTATQYTCSLNSVYRPHWLVQWSHHCSCMHIPVHSPWLPSYTNVIQTVLIILTIIGLFSAFALYDLWLISSIPPLTPLRSVGLFYVAMPLVLFCSSVFLFIRFHKWVRSYGICLSLTGLFPLE